MAKKGQTNIDEQTTAREVEDLCVTYRRGGLSYKRMATVVSETISGRKGAPFKFTEDNARVAVKRALARSLSYSPESAEELRQLELERLDQLQAAMWPRAMGRPSSSSSSASDAPDPQAARVVLDIMRERRELAGLDKLPPIGTKSGGAAVTFSIMTAAEVARTRAAAAAADVQDGLLA